MDHRPVLQKTLEGFKGLQRVYFNPTVNTRMEYPCIRFNRSNRSADFADNKRYIPHESYTIIFITRDETSATDVLDQIESLDYVLFDRHYVADGLHHYVYTKSY